MNLRLVSRMLGIVAWLIGLTMVFSLPIAWPAIGGQDAFESRGFGALLGSIAVCAFTGLVLRLLGKDAAVLAQAAGRKVADGVELLFGETCDSNPFVPVEQMMPFLPFVRVSDVDEAIDKAKYYEHGFRHTSMIHTNSVRNMTKMGRTLDTTLFVKNGPCMSALGLGGEGYISYSIATPTGEGVTTPLTFTRERRCSLIDDLHILGKP